MPLPNGARLAALITVAALVSAAALTPAAQSASKPWTQVTAWGDPDLTGMWPVTHLNGTPVQRPAQFGERRLLTDQEFAEREKQIASDYGTHGRRMGRKSAEANRLTSLVVEPANGRLPALTDEGMRRWSKTMTSSWSEMPFNRIEDFNALDRCISRGLPASMFPFMYNSGIEIMQAPGYVVIRLEIIHETRVIPLDPSTGTAQRRSLRARASAPRSSTGWAIRAGGGKGARSSSRRPTSTGAFR